MPLHRLLCNSSPATESRLVHPRMAPASAPHSLQPLHTIAPHQHRYRPCSTRSTTAAAAASTAPCPATFPVSDLNKHVPPARHGEVAPLALCPSLPPLHTPLLLAPMAGITSSPLRLICADYGAQICTSEMILAHELVAGSQKTQHLAAFHSEERLRSAQLYAVDPRMASEAARMLAAAGVHHIDLNFGCPVGYLHQQCGAA